MAAFIKVQNLDRSLVLANDGLYQFMKLSWPLIDPKPFQDGRILQEVCYTLQAVSEGHITRLIINQPPGTTKTTTVGTIWCVWDWLRYEAKRKFIYASYDKGIPLRGGGQVVKLLRSPWFLERWGRILASNNPGKGELVTVAGGWRFATSVNGRATGWHGDIQVADDPIKPRDANGGANHSDANLKNCLEWWTETMSNRMCDPLTAARIINMQRLHDADLSGHMINDEEDWQLLSLPMRFDEKNKSVLYYKRTLIDEQVKDSQPVVTEVTRGDWRTKEGELLWPERFPLEAVISAERGLRTAAAVSSQMQQKPVPKGGLVFSEADLLWWHHEGSDVLAPNGRPCVPLPQRGGQKVLSLDASFKGKDGSDRCSLGTWWAHGSQRYWIDNRTETWDFLKLLQQFPAMCKKWPLATARLIEDKANGPALVSMLKKSISGLIEVNPHGGKGDRADACTPLWRAGNVVFPHPSMSGYGWVSEAVKEITGFPYYRYDDQVDQMTQALLYLENSSMLSYHDALTN